MGLKLSGWGQLLSLGYTVEHARCGLQVLLNMAYLLAGHSSSS